MNGKGSALLVFERSPEFQKFAQKPGCLAAREEPCCDCQAGFVLLGSVNEQDLLENLECSRGENSPFCLISFSLQLTGGSLSYVTIVTDHSLSIHSAQVN